MIKLTITEKGGEPKALSFEKDEVSIGRVSGNDIVLPKGNVSKRHTKLALRSGQVEISDLKSTNGTYVNGRKITDPMLLSGSDRVYVGDFLITIEGLGAGDGPSVSRRGPAPPPPPLPGARTGSSAANLPVVDEDTGMGGDDEEDQPLAAKPPRSGRVPPPPPPPPRRPPTPLASPALDDDERYGDDVAPPSPREVSADENTGSAGLFERPGAGDDHASFDGTGGRQAGTGRRPGATLPADAAGPAFDRGTSPSEALGAAGGPAAAEGLEALLIDAAVLHIVLSGPDSAYVDRGAGLSIVSTSLGDPNALADALWRIANTAVPPPPPDNPVVDVRLPDGTRVAAVFPPASPSGIVASIRKPGLPARTLADLIPPGAREMQSLLDAAVAARSNLLCTGDAVAIAALLGAIAAAIPSERRVVSIGGALGRARPGWTDLAPTLDMPALVRVAAALRADHLLSAEPVAGEALDLLMIAARGQEGLVIALPARAAAEGLARLEALTVPPPGVGGSAPAPLIGSTIDLVIHAVAAADGAARVIEIAEPISSGTRLTAEPVATWRSEGGRRGGAGGKVQVEGVSARLGAAFAAAGSTLPSGLVRK